MIIADDVRDTDRIHGVWTHIGPVQVMMCLLSCVEEVFRSKAFWMLMLSFNRKIRLFVFSHPQMMIIITFYKILAYKGLARHGVNCESCFWFSIFIYNLDANIGYLSLAFWMSLMFAPQMSKQKIHNNHRANLLTIRTDITRMQIISGNSL